TKENAASDSRARLMATRMCFMAVPAFFSRVGDRVSTCLASSKHSAKAPGEQGMAVRAAGTRARAVRASKIRREEREIVCDNAQNRSAEALQSGDGPPLLAGASTWMIVTCGRPCAPVKKKSELVSSNSRRLQLHK